MDSGRGRMGHSLWSIPPIAPHSLACAPRRRLRHLVGGGEPPFAGKPPPHQSRVTRRLGTIVSVPECSVASDDPPAHSALEDSDRGGLSSRPRQDFRIVPPAGIPSNPCLDGGGRGVDIETIAKSLHGYFSQNWTHSAGSGLELSSPLSALGRRLIRGTF